ncbi:MAG: L,D-transpeptidase family protein [Paracoccus sp. (in: a-proteobacteria)]|uniref:L,D-transpeptidase family protein n=1 Tax=Paracoccus sp. TaxID=267 RepID=UPI0026E0711A|nr:L,D-transpeptidase family protein [Paracoccus sp. (in: a-proteobacteria)]MDO5621483.1 L,D-transpeptidase family protein [Paracoccus sp. (in: a-proteobacteria)]
MILTPQGLLAFGRRLPCSIGRGGISTDKCEGDGATPAGRLRIIGTLYRPDRLAQPAPWARPIGPSDLWCDESGHPAYNSPVRVPFDASHEKLRRADPLYDIILLTDWNIPAQPGKGSAIFLHQWRRPGWPTAGCIAFARADLIWLAARAAPGTGLFVPASSSPKYPNQRRQQDDRFQV